MWKVLRVILTAVWTTWDDIQSSKYVKCHGLRTYIKGSKTSLLTGLTSRECVKVSEEKHLNVCVWINGAEFTRERILLPNDLAAPSSEQNCFPMAKETFRVL
jgi:hypothetical protein